MAVGPFGHHGTIAQLIHLNGLPGAGKTTLGYRWLDDHALTLMVDVDLLRTQLGRWRDTEQSKLLARELAVSLAQTHLAADHDVVLAQCVGNVGYVERLADVAESAGAGFSEVTVSVDPASAQVRFMDRRHRLRRQGQAHPEGEIDDESVPDLTAGTARALSNLLRRRPSIIVVSNDGDIEDTYVAMVRSVARLVGDTGLPDGLRPVRATGVFDHETVPPGLLRAHRVADGVWGRLVVIAGAVRFVFEDAPDGPMAVEAGRAVVIPPRRLHHVEPGQTARFLVEFHRPRQEDDGSDHHAST